MGLAELGQELNLNGDSPSAVCPVAIEPSS